MAQVQALETESPHSCNGSLHRFPGSSTASPVIGLITGSRLVFRLHFDLALPAARDKEITHGQVCRQPGRK